ncbi:MAG: hypothetical protein OEW63_03360 [Gammaproteobacteria bacterium]|nr:hypothetical protein [Gammaproteobacteria bacterium]
MKHISDDQVADGLLLNGVQYINYLKQRIQEIADGQPVWIKPKIIYEDPIHPDSGDIRPMTCFTDRVKVVKIISTNPIRQKHQSVSVGVTILLDYQENHPIAIFDAPAMSSIRTAAMAIISCQFAGFDLDDIYLIGTGQVGKYILNLLNQLNPSSQVKTYDKSTHKEEVIFNSKIVIAATDSREAFLTPDNCSADFIVSVGADTDFNHELTPAFLQSRNHIYVDCLDAKNVGDLPLLTNPDIKGDVFDLFRSKNADTLVSVGSPLMDALTVEYLMQSLSG